MRDRFTVGVALTDRVDVLLVAALPEEFAAARTAGTAATPDGPGVAAWEERGAGSRLPYLWGSYRTPDGRRLSVALTRPTHMGGRESSPIASTLADRLNPACVAMCGVCAGNPGETALGDVVVADPVYEWDEGKWTPSGFAGDHRQYRLDPVLVRAAQDLDPTGLPSYGAADVEDARAWLLERLHFGQDPKSHPARSRYFPTGQWAPRLDRFAAEGLITRLPDGGVTLTDTGAALVRRRLYDDVDGPQRLPFRVVVAPMASGSAVVADATIWPGLQAMGMRKIAAVEMEAATIATVAHQAKVPYWLAVKGVMDHAGTAKDDRYKEFAARASAEVLFALLDRVTMNRPATAEPGGPGTVSITLNNASGVQIGNGNTQTNTWHA